MKYPKIITLILIISNYAFSQEIKITIDTINIEYRDNSIIIPYKFKNLSDYEIIFLDKKEFISEVWCYKISNTKIFYEKDTTRAIDDFVILKPQEVTERKALVYLHWPCRSMPKGTLHAAYNSVITNDVMFCFS
jgi:hypothetical protein